MLESIIVKNIIRNFFVLVVANYTFYKLLNISLKTKISQISTIFLLLLVSIVSTFLFKSNLSLNWLFILLFFFIHSKLSTKLTWSTTYMSVLFSFTLSYISFSLSTVIAVFPLLPFYLGQKNLPWFFIQIFIGIIHFFIIYFCFHIPRLQKGMVFLYNIPSFNIGSSLCFFLIMLIFMLSQLKTPFESFTLKFASLIIFCTFLLLYWWNYHLTQTYRKYLRRNELATLELLLTEKDTEITHLKTENDKLSRLIHKDNKMIPALTMAVEDFLQNANKLPPAELEQLGSSLQTQLTLLYDDRLAILNSYEQELYPLPSTGLTSVNGVLVFMQQKALQAGIQFQFIFSNSPSSVIPDKIPEKDFSHLLSDLLDNAVIAAGCFPSGIVRVHMGSFDNIYTLKIFNTGQPFPVEVLQDMGINRHTTHETAGGSGIGMMDIWELKEQYSLTLLIDEITDSSHETTSTTINILFNNKNHYIIQTDRYKELVGAVNRPDLLILSKD